MDIQVQIPPDPDRMRRALRQLVRRRIWMRWGVCIASGVAGLLFLVAAHMPWVGFVLLAEGVILFVVTEFEIRAQIRRRGALLNGPTTLRLTDEGLRSANPAASTDFAWHAFERAEETGEFWFLHLPGRHAIILPRQVFGPSQHDELRRFLVGRRLLAAGGPVADVRSAVAPHSPPVRPQP